MLLSPHVAKSLQSYAMPPLPSTQPDWSQVTLPSLPFHAASSGPGAPPHTPDWAHQLAPAHGLTKHHPSSLRGKKVGQHCSISTSSITRARRLGQPPGHQLARGAGKKQLPLQLHKSALVACSQLKVTATFIQEARLHHYASDINVGKLACSQLIKGVLNVAPNISLIPYTLYIPPKI